MIQKLKGRSLGLLSKILKWLLGLYLGILRYFEQLEMESLGYKFVKSPFGGYSITMPTIDELNAAYKFKLRRDLLIIGFLVVNAMLMLVVFIFASSKI